MLFTLVHLAPKRIAVASESRHHMIGQTLAHYRVTAALGAGGMGEVWRAEDIKLGRDVALKVLPAEFASDPDRMPRCGREAKVLASLNDANSARRQSPGCNRGPRHPRQICRRCQPAAHPPVAR